MTGYCIGIRLNDIFQERVCEHREYCPYYKNSDLSTSLSNPDEYVELDTYNNQEQCKYFDKSWKQETHQTCETSDMPMDGILTLWSKDL